LILIFLSLLISIGRADAFCSVFQFLTPLSPTGPPFQGRPKSAWNLFPPVLFYCGLGVGLSNFPPLLDPFFRSAGQVRIFSPRGAPRCLLYFKRLCIGFSAPFRAILKSPPVIWDGLLVPRCPLFSFDGADLCSLVNPDCRAFWSYCFFFCFCGSCEQKSFLFFPLVSRRVPPSVRVSPLFALFFRIFLKLRRRNPVFPSFFILFHRFPPPFFANNFFFFFKAALHFSFFLVSYAPNRSLYFLTVGLLADPPLVSLPSFLDL